MEHQGYNYKTALYCRLSLDDGKTGDSTSIQTQKVMLEKYCVEHGFNIVDFYVDDGYSGLNFNRDGFQRMLKDIDEGKINMVITKDLSRLGRDYLQTGYYTEIFFPDRNIRYIAINDGIDTLKADNDIAPFKNILNDMYAKDLSRKVKSAKRQRMADIKELIEKLQQYDYLKDKIDMIGDDYIAINFHKYFSVRLRGIKGKQKEQRLMEKLDGKSPDLTAENVERLKALFPEVVAEGKVDLDKLLTLLGEAVDDGKEKYAFTWKGKMDAIRIAQTRSTGTLRPCKEESVNFDTTQNLYIEGDNLEVLKLLASAYNNSIKMIYIDPPYNTGGEFVYADSFGDSLENYKRITGQTQTSNAETAGRYHTNWLNLMYPRLKLAHVLLKDDGVIFISIDDHEVTNLRRICDEIFGEDNFIAQLIWERAYSPKNDAKYISNSHDYVLVYAKSLTEFGMGRLDRTEEANARYSNPDNDSRGDWKPGDMSVKTYTAAYDYPITTPSGRVVEPPTGRCWRFPKKSFEEAVADNRIWFGANGDSVPSVKRFLNELKFEGMAPTSIMFYKDVGHSQEGAKEVTALLEAGAFNGPKPVRLLRRLLTLANLSKDDIVLDFFSGSATTAHAVMDMNAEDGGKRKWIMVQLPEYTDENGEARKAGYNNICEIGKERIRRAGAKIAEENRMTAPDLDIGFKVFKLDSTNLIVWDNSYTEDEEVQ